MGFPVTSNIFKPYLDDRHEFREFPIQVAVLHKPDERDFGNWLRDNFLRLHQETGRHVVFFALLDPPEEWLETARSLDRWSWWDYRNRSRRTGFTPNDRVLVMEIARLFGMDWEELPALIVSTDLWGGDFFTTPTSVHQLEDQLLGLTRLVRTHGRPTAAYILDTLAKFNDKAVKHYSNREELLERLKVVDEVLDTYDLERNRFTPKYWRYLGRELRSLATLLARVRQLPEEEQEENSRQADLLIDEAVGVLVPLAEVALRSYNERQNIPGGLQALEEKSRVMLETSQLVGRFLEFVDQKQVGEFFPRDYTPGAQGAWKTLELEVNLSLIQAARKARAIEMPAYFARHRPNFHGNSIVITGVSNGRRIEKNLNKKDTRGRDKGHHAFFTLGDAWHITTTMINDANEEFDKVIRECLTYPLPSAVLQEWKVIHDIRNRASHTEPLTRGDYHLVVNAMTRPEFLRPLLKIKQALRGPAAS